MTDNRRKFSRRELDGVEGMLYFGGQEYPARVKDLSFRGTRLDLTPNGGIPEQTELSLRVQSPDCRIYVRARVLSVRDGQMRLKFTGIGESSLNNLRQLLISSSRDPDELERELSNLTLRLI